MEPAKPGALLGLPECSYLPVPGTKQCTTACALPTRGTRHLVTVLPIPTASRAVPACSKMWLPYASSLGAFPIPS